MFLGNEGRLVIHVKHKMLTLAHGKRAIIIVPQYASDASYNIRYDCLQIVFRCIFAENRARVAMKISETQYLNDCHHTYSKRRAVASSLAIVCLWQVKHELVFPGEVGDPEKSLVRVLNCTQRSG